ncbi:glycosyltransferase family 2 protein [Campylobacter concisus]|uniref:glycosyltransferase family 2 protein n=2 Tax=Campylobacter concisus TaxID=199 RepID=UPI000934BCF9|nr:glycosyltransferase family 2 protein [Campylobacter concisus]
MIDINKNPVVSVVMSVYNAEKYLDAAIRSILEQTYNNFEFIIINDGSNDRSLEIIKKYKNEDDRIVLVSRENRGLISSLNEGIAKARGEYIVRMDADDISLPFRIEKQLQVMEHEKDIVVCGSWINIFGENINEKVARYFEHDKQIKANLLVSCCFAHPSVMIRKDAFTNNNILYDERFKNAEDYHLWTQLAKVGKFYNIPEILLKYRFLETSITRLSDKDCSKRYNVLKDIFKEALKAVDLSINEEDMKVHFIISDNARIKNNKIELKRIKNYFDKILKASENKQVVDLTTLKQVLGRRWLYNLICHKDIRAIFYSYFWFGVASVLKGK